MAIKRSAGLWLPVLLWAALIWHLSNTPNLRIVASWWDYPLRKVAHMVVFGLLARLIARAFTGDTYWSWKKIFWTSLLLTSLYACSDEYHQTFVAGRHGSPVDVLIDALGAWIAMGFVP